MFKLALNDKHDPLSAADMEKVGNGMKALAATLREVKLDNQASLVESASTWYLLNASVRTKPRFPSVRGDGVA